MAAAAERGAELPAEPPRGARPPPLGPEEVARRLASTRRELSNRRKILLRNLPAESSSQQPNDLINSKHNLENPANLHHLFKKPSRVTVDREGLLAYRKMLAADNWNRITLSDTGTVLLLAPVARSRYFMNSRVDWLKAHLTYLEAIKFGIPWSDKECYRDILA